MTACILMFFPLVASVPVMHSEWLKARNILVSSNTRDEMVHGFIGNLKSGMSMLYIDKSGVTSEKDLHTFTTKVNYLIYPAARFFIATVDSEASIKDSLDKINPDQRDLLANFYEVWLEFLATSRQIAKSCQPGLFTTGFLKSRSFGSINEKYHSLTSKLRAAFSLILADVELPAQFEKTNIDLPARPAFTSVPTELDDDCRDFIGGGTPKAEIITVEGFKGIKGDIVGCRHRADSEYLVVKVGECPGELAVPRDLLLSAGIPLKRRLSSLLPAIIAFGLIILISGITGYWLSVRPTDPLSVSIRAAASEANEAVVGFIARHSRSNLTDSNPQPTPNATLAPENAAAIVDSEPPGLVPSNSAVEQSDLPPSVGN